MRTKSVLHTPERVLEVLRKTAPELLRGLNAEQAMRLAVRVADFHNRAEFGRALSGAQARA